jgi:predicted nucleic acid-binding protein
LKLVLDTNIYSDYAEGLSDVVETIIQYGQELFIPSIVIGELTYGFLKGNRQLYNERKLLQIIKGLQIEIISVNADVARKYGFIFLALQKKGTKIPINDVWIASCCMAVSGVLLTRDHHFEKVEQIETMILPS